jgi:DNA-binding GntR family transcriptional regulator
VSEAQEDLPTLPPAVFFRDNGDSFAVSQIVTRVFDTILAAVHDGRLQPGDRISDSALAQQLGVSRTPVREALQRLREIGIIEASASRFTRIALVTPQQTADAMVVWLALYAAVIAEVVPTVPPEMIAAMNADHVRFVDSLNGRDAGKIAQANAEFFAHLVGLSQNETLKKSVTAVVHQIRLGSLYLPRYIDLGALSESQQLLIAAVRDHDGAAARGALQMLGLIEVPMSDDEPD